MVFGTIAQAVTGEGALHEGHLTAVAGEVDTGMETTMIPLHHILVQVLVRTLKGLGQVLQVVRAVNSKVSRASGRELLLAQRLAILPGGLMVETSSTMTKALGGVMGRGGIGTMMATVIARVLAGLRRLHRVLTLAQDSAAPVDADGNDHSISSLHVLH